MTEKKKDQEQDQLNAAYAWEEVGKQFQTLGKSLASTFNASIQDEKVQRDINAMRVALDTTAAQIKQKAKEVSDSVESVNVEGETKKLDEQTQAAGQDLVKEVQPQLVNALKKVRTGLDQIIRNLEQQDSASFSTAGDSGAGQTTSESDR